MHFSWPFHHHGRTDNHYILPFRSITWLSPYLWMIKSWADQQLTQRLRICLKTVVNQNWSKHTGLYRLVIPSKNCQASLIRWLKVFIMHPLMIEISRNKVITLTLGHPVDFLSDKRLRYKRSVVYCVSHWYKGEANGDEIFSHLNYKLGGKVLPELAGAMLFMLNLIMFLAWWWG